MVVESCSSTQATIFSSSPTICPPLIGSSPMSLSPSVGPQFVSTPFITIPTCNPMAAYNVTLNPLIITPANWKQSYGMEHVWVNQFNELFSNYIPHQWYITPVEVKPIGGNSLVTFVDSAKVCGHGWTSMKGRVAFWFDFFVIYGIVAFKLYGQRCDKCKTDRYEQPMWYPEEVEKVIVNVYNRVGEVYYGFQRPPIEKTRRIGKPRTPHNSDLCQACKDNVCSVKF